MENDFSDSSHEVFSFPFRFAAAAAPVAVAAAAAALLTSTAWLVGRIARSVDAKRDLDILFVNKYQVEQLFEDTFFKIV